MKTLHVYAKTIFLLILLIVASCGIDNPTEPGNTDTTFSVSPETLEFTAAAGRKDVGVTGGGDWYLGELGENWCKAEKHGVIILVDVTENLARQERTCNLPICHDNTVYYLKITQAGRETNPERPEVPEGGYTLNDATVIADSEVNALLDGGYDNGQWEKAFFLKKPVPEGKLPVQGENWVFNTPTETFPDGCLTFIQEVKDMGDHYEVRYTDAGLSACFRDLNLPEQELDITPYVTRIEDGNGRPLSFSRTKAVSKSEPFEIKIHPGSISMANLEIEPTISLSTVLKTRVDIEDYRLYCLDFVVDTDCTIEMDYDVSAGVDFNYYMPVLKVYMAAIPVGPLLVTPFLEVDLNVGSCIQGSINAKYEYSRHFRASAHYDDFNSWSLDFSSPAQDDSGWKPSRLGPKLKCSTRYGISVGPEIGIYGDVVSVGLGVSANMQHEVGVQANLWEAYNFVSILQESDYTTSFILGAHLSARGMGFPVSLSLPDLEFPVCSYKMLPSIGSVECDCAGTSAHIGAWLKNKTLYTDLPMRVRLFPSAGDAQDEIIAEFGDVPGKLKQLNDGADSVYVDAYVSLPEGVEYTGRIEMYFGEEIGWSAMPGNYLRVISVSTSSLGALKEILSDIYSCRSGEWNGCNWMEPNVNVAQLAQVSFLDGHWTISIPQDWKFTSNLKIGNHTDGVSDFKTWSLNASGNDKRSFTNVEVKDKKCTSFNVGEHVENYSMHSTKLTMLDIPEDVRTLDLSGTEFPDLSFYLGTYENLQSIKLDACSKLTKLSLSASKLTALPTLNISNCSLLQRLTLQYMIVGENAFKNISWPSGFKSITLEHSKIAATALDVAVPELSVYTSTCGDLAISGCNGMKNLWLSLDNAGSISVSQCQTIQTLRVGWNMCSLSVTGCQSLTSLTARETQMSSFSASALPSLIDLDLYNNKNLTGVMLPIFDEVRSKPGSTLSYDKRYWYYSDGTWTDEGYGYYYPEEPDCGYHLR
ncbi:MAG: hypothetical protein MJY56_03955 [Bacteroidales bacterium]|nr:hypothetical protein [Bacteroidales bacterium]